MLEQMLKAYPETDGRFDELFEAPRKPRAHWLRFFRALPATSTEEIRARLAGAERQIRDSGVTYNVYATRRALTGPGIWTCCRCSFRRKSGANSKPE